MIFAAHGPLSGNSPANLRAPEHPGSTPCPGNSDGTSNFEFHRSSTDSRPPDSMTGASSPPRDVSRGERPTMLGLRYISSGSPSAERPASCGTTQSFGKFFSIFWDQHRPVLSKNKNSTKKRWSSSGLPNVWGSLLFQYVHGVGIHTSVIGMLSLPRKRSGGLSGIRKTQSPILCNPFTKAFPLKCSVHRCTPLGLCVVYHSMK